MQNQVRYKIQEKESIMADIKRNVEYMCSYCGKKQVKLINMGRPMPGTCPRRNGSMPHRWITNKKF